MNATFRLIDKHNIGTIKPLWKKLNEMHLQDSHYFKDHFANFTFEKRCEKICAMDENKLRVEIIEDNQTIVGYCIATIEKNVGEIDSLFVEEEHRQHGYGGQLVERCITWFKMNGCITIKVGVAEGHESVFRFYQKFGFYPRMTYLEMKE